MRLTILSWKRLYTVLDLKSNFLYGIGSVKFLANQISVIDIPLRWMRERFGKPL